jgi:CRISPR system Cascade subunit CasE
MCDAYGEWRLQPFSVEEKMGRVKVLGYGAVGADEMRRLRLEAAEPETANCVVSEDSKVMPSIWDTGRRFAFRLRVAPTRQGHDPDGKRVERDAVLCDKVGADRETIYRQWLEERLGNAVSLERCDIERFSILEAVRRSDRGKSGKRPARVIGLPDVVFSGSLTVSDSEQFAAILRKGVGRHRSFGFGALMLRPARAAA